MKKEQNQPLQKPFVNGSLPLQTKLEMFYDFLYERGVAKQLGVGIDTIVKHFIDEKLSGNDQLGMFSSDKLEQAYKDGVRDALAKGYGTFNEENYR